jgi:tripartite-type tricarboxylate transporter receptor subunit TctC
MIAKMLRASLPRIPILLMAFVSGLSFAQDYPSRPIRVLTAQAGGGNDFVARILAPAMAASLGQSVIIDNRTGLVSAETVAKAPPDGYTVLLTGSSFWVSPFFREVPYDPVKEFTPVSQATRSPNILVVHPALPVKSVKELIALARARPGDLNYAASQIGSPAHLTAELMKSMARLNIVLINYKGAGPAITALMSGEVQLMFSAAGSVTPHIRAGRLKALGVTSAEPSALVPGIPPVAATIPGFEVVSIIGFFAPARTPDAVVSKLSQEITRVLARPEIEQRFFVSGAEAIGSTPGQFGSEVRAEMSKWSKLIKQAALRAE